jgi:hemoglobin
MSSVPWGSASTPYVEIGEDVGVRALVDAFYDEVESSSPVLRAMLPLDLSHTRDKFHAFLSGWLGGPQLYVERYGHPQLRMRHFPFSIGRVEADEWMRCMREAFGLRSLNDDLVRYLDERFTGLALHMINRDEAVSS